MIKTSTYKDFNNKELKEIRETLTKLYVNLNAINELPEEIKSHIRPISNTTKLNRCIAILDKVIVNRFLEIKH